jgi:hypothetical protein
MLRLFFNNQLYLGLAQAFVAALAAISVVLLARKRGIHLESETANRDGPRPGSDCCRRVRPCCYCCAVHAGPEDFSWLG